MRSGKICTAIVQIFMFYWWGNSKLFPREKENNNKDDNFISDKCQSGLWLVEKAAFFDQSSSAETDWKFLIIMSHLTSHINGLSPFCLTFIKCKRIGPTDTPLCWRGCESQKTVPTRYLAVCLSWRGCFRCVETVFGVLRAQN